MSPLYASSIPSWFFFTRVPVYSPNIFTGTLRCPNARRSASTIQRRVQESGVGTKTTSLTASSLGPPSGWLSTKAGWRPASGKEVAVTPR